MEGTSIRVVITPLSEPDEIKNKMDYITNNKIASNVENIYGDGNTGEKIVKMIG